MSIISLGVARAGRLYWMSLYCAPFFFLLMGDVACAAMARSQRPAAVGAVVERLQLIAPAIERAVSCPRPQQLAGRYSLETPRLAEIMGGGYLSGGSLYLFRDGSYLYTEWADISPETVMDNGRWSLHDDLLELNSDGPAVEKGSLHDTRYVVFCLTGSGRGELRIIGSDHQLGELEKDFREDPGAAVDRRFLVMLHSRERLEEYATPEASRRTKEDLRRRLERPDGSP